MTISGRLSTSLIEVRRIPDLISMGDCPREGSLRSLIRFQCRRFVSASVVYSQNARIKFIEDLQIHSSRDDQFGAGI